MRDHTTDDAAASLIWRSLSKRKLNAQFLDPLEEEATGGSMQQRHLNHIFEMP